jgi:hypothetical protein
LIYYRGIIMKIVLTFILLADIAFGNSLLTNVSKQHIGVVKETMNAGGYTYMLVQENSEDYWVAVAS